MSLLSRKSDTHNHLSRSSKRHSGTHTVTPAHRAADHQPKQRGAAPFGELRFGTDTAATGTASKPVLGL